MGRGTELGKNRRNRRKIKNTNGNVNEQNEERRNEEHRRRSLENFGIDMLLSLLSLMKEKREKTSKGGYLFLPFLFQEKLNLDI
jgi:hypothetical protein